MGNIYQNFDTGEFTKVDNLFASATEHFSKGKQQSLQDYQNDNNVGMSNAITLAAYTNASKLGYTDADDVEDNSSEAILRTIKAETFGVAKGIFQRNGGNKDAAKLAINFIKDTFDDIGSYSTDKNRFYSRMQSLNYTDNKGEAGYKFADPNYGLKVYKAAIDDGIDISASKVSSFGRVILDGSAAYRGAISALASIGNDWAKKNLITTAAIYDNAQQSEEDRILGTSSMAIANISKMAVSIGETVGIMSITGGIGISAGASQWALIGRSLVDQSSSDYISSLGLASKIISKEKGVKSNWGQFISGLALNAVTYRAGMVVGGALETTLLNKYLLPKYTSLTNTMIKNTARLGTDLLSDLAIDYAVYNSVQAVSETMDTNAMMPTDYNMFIFMDKTKDNVSKIKGHIFQRLAMRMSMSLFNVKNIKTIFNVDLKNTNYESNQWFKDTYGKEVPAFMQGLHKFITSATPNKWREMDTLLTDRGGLVNVMKNTEIMNNYLLIDMYRKLEMGSNHAYKKFVDKYGKDSEETKKFMYGAAKEREVGGKLYELLVAKSDSKIKFKIDNPESQKKVIKYISHLLESNKDLSNEELFYIMNENIMSVRDEGGEEVLNFKTSEESPHNIKTIIGKKEFIKSATDANSGLSSDQKERFFKLLRSLKDTGMISDTKQKLTLDKIAKKSINDYLKNADNPPEIVHQFRNRIVSDSDLNTQISKYKSKHDGLKEFLKREASFLKVDIDDEKVLLPNEMTQDDKIALDLANHIEDIEPNKLMEGIAGLKAHLYGRDDSVLNEVSNGIRTIANSNISAEQKTRKIMLSINKILKLVNIFGRKFNQEDLVKIKKSLKTLASSDRVSPFINDEILTKTFKNVANMKRTSSESVIDLIIDDTFNPIQLDRISAMHSLASTLLAEPTDSFFKDEAFNIYTTSNEGEDIDVVANKYMISHQGLNKWFGNKNEVVIINGTKVRLSEVKDPNISLYGMILKKEVSDPTETLALGMKKLAILGEDELESFREEMSHYKIEVKTSTNNDGELDITFPKDMNSDQLSQIARYINRQNAEVLMDSTVNIKVKGTSNNFIVNKTPLGVNEIISKFNESDHGFEKDIYAMASYIVSFGNYDKSIKAIDSLLLASNKKIYDELGDTQREMLKHQIWVEGKNRTNKAQALNIQFDAKFQNITLDMIPLSIEQNKTGMDMYKISTDSNEEVTQAYLKELGIVAVDTIGANDGVLYLRLPTGKVGDNKNKQVMSKYLINGFSEAQKFSFTSWLKSNNSSIDEFQSGKQTYLRMIKDIITWQKDELTNTGLVEKQADLAEKKTNIANTINSTIADLEKQIEGLTKKIVSIGEDATRISKILPPQEYGEFIQHIALKQNNVAYNIAQWETKLISLGFTEESAKNSIAYLVDKDKIIKDIEDEKLKVQEEIEQNKTALISQEFGATKEDATNQLLKNMANNLKKLDKAKAYFESKGSSGDKELLLEAKFASATYLDMLRFFYEDDIAKRVGILSNANNLFKEEEVNNIYKELELELADSEIIITTDINNGHAEMPRYIVDRIANKVSLASGAAKVSVNGYNGTVFKGLVTTSIDNAFRFGADDFKHLSPKLADILLSKKNRASNDVVVNKDGEIKIIDPVLKRVFISEMLLGLSQHANLTSTSKGLANVAVNTWVNTNYAQTNHLLFDYSNNRTQKINAIVEEMTSIGENGTLYEFQNSINSAFRRQGQTPGLVGQAIPFDEINDRDFIIGGDKTIDEFDVMLSPSQLVDILTPHIKNLTMKNEYDYHLTTDERQTAIALFEKLHKSVLGRTDLDNHAITTNQISSLLAIAADTKGNGGRGTIMEEGGVYYLNLTRHPELTQNQNVPLAIKGVRNTNNHFGIEITRDLMLKFLGDFDGDLILGSPLNKKIYTSAFKEKNKTIVETIIEHRTKMRRSFMDNRLHGISNKDYIEGMKDIPYEGIPNMVGGIQRAVAEIVDLMSLNNNKSLRGVIKNSFKQEQVTMNVRKDRGENLPNELIPSSADINVDHSSIAKIDSGKFIIYDTDNTTTKKIWKDVYGSISKASPNGFISEINNTKDFYSLQVKDKIGNEKFLLLKKDASANISGGFTIANVTDDFTEMVGKVGEHPLIGKQIMGMTSIISTLGGSGVNQASKRTLNFIIAQYAARSSDSGKAERMLTDNIQDFILRSFTASSLDLDLGSNKLAYSNVSVGEDGIAARGSNTSLLAKHLIDGGDLKITLQDIKKIFNLTSRNKPNQEDLAGYLQAAAKIHPLLSKGGVAGLDNLYHQISPRMVNVTIAYDALSNATMETRPMLNKLLIENFESEYPKVIQMINIPILDKDGKPVLDEFNNPKTKVLDLGVTANKIGRWLQVISHLHPLGEYDKDFLRKFSHHVNTAPITFAPKITEDNIISKILNLSGLYSSTDKTPISELDIKNMLDDMHITFVKKKIASMLDNESVIKAFENFDESTKEDIKTREVMVMVYKGNDTKPITAQQFFNYLEMNIKKTKGYEKIVTRNAYKHIASALAGLMDESSRTHLFLINEGLSSNIAYKLASDTEDDMLPYNNKFHLETIKAIADSPSNVKVFDKHFSDSANVRKMLNNSFDFRGC